MEKVIVLVFISVSLAAGKIQKWCQNKPADIVFVIDESGSIWGEDFVRRQIPFVKNVSNMFDISKTATQVGVITFSDEPKLYFHLNRYSEKKDVLDAVSKIRQRRGGTDTFDAIKYMRDVSFSPQNGARNGVAKIGIILSDGESSNKTKTVAEAKAAKEAGIKLFAIAVGIGNRKDKQQAQKMEAELKDIASDPDSNYFFKVESYASLASIREKLAIRACQVSTLPPPTTTTTEPTTTLPQMLQGCRGEYAIDAVFALSDSSAPADTMTAIDFVKSMAKDAEISPEKIQVGLAPSTCETRDGIMLKECPTKKKLMAELEKRKPSGSHPEKAMKMLQTESFTKEQGGGRFKAVKFGIVFIDARLGNPEKAIKQSESTEDGGINLIIIAVGDNVKPYEDTLKELAKDDNHFFWVQDYSKLSTKKKKLGKLFCDAVKTGGRSAEHISNFKSTEEEL